MVFENIKITISPSLYNEIYEYCKLNGLDFNKYIEKLLKKAFLVDKYGEAPSVLVSKAKPDEKEVNIEVVEQKTIDTIVVEIPSEENKPTQILVEEEKKEEKKTNRRKLS